MDSAKKIKFLSIYIGLLFIVFPFGQILRYELYLNQIRLVLLPLDIIASFSVFIVYFFKIKNTPIDEIIKNIFYVIVFSLLFSLSILKPAQILVGAIYFFRLVIYYYLFRLFWGFIADKKKNNKLISDYLKIALGFVGLFGWIQYFLYPDLRNFTVWGWDDHLFRLVGTLLDPAFMGLLMVFAVLISLNALMQRKTKFDLLLTIYFLLTLAFTYSRASFLALIGGVFVLFLKNRYFKRFVLFSVIFVLIIVFLPRPDGSGVQLERLFSIKDRIINYSQTFNIWKSSPIFGVGYNNICEAKKLLNISFLITSHSCYGVDSSILFILATTGIVGFLIVGYSLLSTITILLKQKNGTLPVSLIAALVLHSQFGNSLFYPWSLVVIGVILTTSLSAKIER